MTLMNPWLLLAGLGVALPILAHLLNRYQVKRTDWAAMQFLNRSVRVRSRQMRLRDILLLLLRCAAIMALIFGVARPSMQDADGAAAQLGERRAGVVIALDASYSMQHRSAGGETRFARALETIETITETVQPGDPISLVLLGDEHQVVAHNMIFEPRRFASLLREQKSRPEQLNLETLPATLSGLVSDMPAMQKEVYLVTDLQAGDWRNPSPWLREGLKELNAVARTMVVPVPGHSTNLAVTDFSLFSGLLRKGTVAQYRATVHNYGSEDATRVRVRCKMEGSDVDVKTIPVIKGGSSQTVSFYVPFHSAGSVRLTAEIDDDGLLLDNTRRAVAHVRGRVSVLCVEGGSSGAGLESFISKAIRARGGGASGKEDFTVRSVSWLALPSQDLKAFDIVILADVPEITEEQARQLGDFVRAGNGLVWFGGNRVKSGVWNKRAALEGGALLPAVLGDVQKVSDAMGVGRPLDPTLPAHPVCRPLRSLPKDLLSETQFYQLLELEPLPACATVLTLSGSATPVLVEQRFGRGHVFMFATSADPTWNNMALTPAFPMLMQQIVTYLTGREFERSRLVGSSLSLSYADRPDANDAVFETPSGDTVRVPVREHAGQYVAFLEHARESGFHVARVSVQSAGEPIAVNVDTAESDVRCLDSEEAQRILDDTGTVVSAAPADHIDQVRAGREYGRLLLSAALVMLVLDSLIASGMGSRLFGRGRTRGKDA